MSTSTSTSSSCSISAAATATLSFSPRRSLRLSFSVQHFFFSSNFSATPRTTLCLLFRMIIDAFLFPQSFRDNLRHTQSCVSSGVLPSPTPGPFQGYDESRPWVIFMAPRYLQATRMSSDALMHVTKKTAFVHHADEGLHRKPLRSICTTQMFHVLPLCKTSSELFK